MARTVQCRNQYPQHHRFHNQEMPAPPVVLNSAMRACRGGVDTAKRGFVSSRSALTATKSIPGPIKSHPGESGRCWWVDRSEVSVPQRLKPVSLLALGGRAESRALPKPNL
jgi:hypothetical protein